MKKNILTLPLILLSILFSNQHLNAQTHKTILSLNKNTLPFNRAAFIYCYNNSGMYKNNNTIAFYKENTNHIGTSYAQPTTKEISEENICIFSNVTEDELWVQLNNVSEEKKGLNVEIYNVSGERIYNSRIEQSPHKINLCQLTAGTFLVRMGDVVKKLVIE